MVESGGVEGGTTAGREGGWGGVGSKTYVLAIVPQNVSGSSMDCLYSFWYSSGVSAGFRQSIMMISPGVLGHKLR